MKRTRYDAEYDKVRKGAGLARPQYDFPDDEKSAERQSEDRVQAMADDFRDRMAALAAAESQRTAEMQARHDRRAVETRDRILRREYEALGLKVPHPMVSLGLLLSIGWKIDSFMIGGVERFELIRPPLMNPPKSDPYEKDMNT